MRLSGLFLRAKIIDYFWYVCAADGAGVGRGAAHVFYAAACTRGA